MKYKQKMKFGTPLMFRRRPRPLRYRYRVSRGVKWVFILCAFVYVVGMAAFNTYPLIIDVSRNLLEMKATEIINRAVAESIEEISYEDLVDITYNESGEIAALVANTELLNSLKSSVALHILETLEKTGSDGFEIPLGNLTDVIFLSGIGPRIPFRIIPYGSVDVDFKDSFAQAGINQTKHEIHIQVTANMNAVSSVARVKCAVNTDIMAAHTVIVGKVPQWYGDDLDR